MKRVFILLQAFTITALNCSAQLITESEKTQIPGSKSIIYGAKISLPAKGLWMLKNNVLAEGSAHLYLVAPKTAAPQFTGKRMAMVKRNENIDRGRNHLRNLAYPCLEYARNNDGVGPTTIQDLGEKQAKNLERSINSSPWGQSEYKKLEGPFYAILPLVKFKFDGDIKRGRVLPADKTVLAIELRPFVDDDKHWVVYTDRTSERVAIDHELLKKLNLSIRPVLSKEDVSEDNKPQSYSYQLLSLCSAGAPTKLNVEMYNPMTDQTLSSVWSVSATEDVNDGLLVELEKARQTAWLPYLSTLSSPALKTWISGTKAPDSVRRFLQQGSMRGRSTSAIGILGGRAAIQETLQMQLIRGGSQSDKRTVDITTLEGVTVKSHPFEDMLKGKMSDELPLADFVPADHFFVYIAKPESILPMLQDGADFLSQLGGTFTGSNVKYYLKDRYLKRLGLDQKWLQALLDCGAVVDCALISPDLFFIDGTETTVISRLSTPKLMAPLLEIAGVKGLSGANPVEIKNSAGKSVFWMMNKGVLIVSTSRTEIDMVAALISKDGEGSLGKTAEFRYMLTKLPLSEKSRGLAYFSDPFIRKLVSPATKIAQMRRANAKATLQLITGKALLAKLDGVEDISIASLKQLGYIGASFNDEGFTLNDDFTTASVAYRSLSDLATLSETPVTMITTQEKSAYNRYMQNYTRFWRQFFDPIAIRLDDTTDNKLTATTFILPLIDSSIYNGLKDAVMNAEDGNLMKTPKFAPEPVLSLSVNLKEQKWQEMTKTLAMFTSQYSGINPAILDDLGPEIHLAVKDADPVIVMGSGDFMGLAGSSVMRRGFGSQMMTIPFVISTLTRPCTIAIATKNPQSTLSHLRMAANGLLSGNMSRGSSELNVKFYKLKDRDSWVYSMNAVGMLKIRLGIEVRDGFLFIQNIPWSKKSEVVEIVESQFNGVRLAIAPEASKLELPGLFAATSEQQSAAAFSGASMLYPLMACGYQDIESARNAHMKFFGYMPKHCDGGNWVWKDGNISSTTYGSIQNKLHPEYQEGNKEFGLLKKIRNLSVETRFEEDGLRTKIEWQPR